MYIQNGSRGVNGCIWHYLVRRHAVARIMCSICEISVDEMRHLELPFLKLHIKAVSMITWIRVSRTTVPVRMLMLLRTLYTYQRNSENLSSASSQSKLSSSFMNKSKDSDKGMSMALSANICWTSSCTSQGSARYTDSMPAREGERFHTLNFSSMRYIWGSYTSGLPTSTEFPDNTLPAPRSIGGNSPSKATQTMCWHRPVQGPEVNTQIMQEKVLGEGAIVGVVENGGQESIRNWIKQELILTIVRLTPI